MTFNLDDYKTVAERIKDFREKHPEGCLRPADPEHPYRLEQIGDKTYVVVVAAAYRAPDDPTPGIGMAYEQIPGATQFTRDSELQNAETAAWGRAVIAVLASESKQIASQDEVRFRQADPDAPPPNVKPSSSRECVVCHQDLAGAKAKKHGQGWVHDPLCEKPADDPNEEPF